MNCGETQEIITALVDNELDRGERSALEAHLNECSGCRLAFEEELALKRKIRQAGERMYAPALLRSRILSDRRIFPENRGLARRWLENLWPRSPVYQAVLALAFLVLLILPTYYLSNRISQPVGLAAIETYDSFRRGELKTARSLLTRHLRLVQPSADALWLGARIESRLGDSTALASYGTQLKNRYPNAAQTRAFNEGKFQ